MVLLLAACQSVSQPAKRSGALAQSVCQAACMPPALLSSASSMQPGEPRLVLISLHGGGPPDAAFALSPVSIELRDLEGRLIWSVPVTADRTPHLVATGDFDGDGVTDGIFQILVTPANPTRCGTGLVRTTRLMFVSGARGAVSWPLGPTPDICWDGFGTTPPYTTHQWALGTAYIGPTTSSASNDVAVLPYYAARGLDLHDSSSGWSTVVEGAVSKLIFPSTPEFDQVYDAANPTPCSDPIAGGPCYVSNSHVANAVFVDAASGGGLFVLTSWRAFIYGSDLRPHSDLTWLSGGRTDNSGRNYGMLENLPGKPGQIVLIGGCGGEISRYSMLTGTPFGGPCGLHHHYEWFSVSDGHIVAHASKYYGYSGTDGPWEGRIEYPFHAASGFAGTPGTMVFNLYRNGQWRVVVMTDPSRPESAREFPGWYVWDNIELPNGSVQMLATGAPGGGGDLSRVLPWEFNVLQWNGAGLVSRHHIDGLVPAIVAYAPTAGLHTSDDLPYGGLTTRATSGTWLLVEDRSGNRSEMLID